MEKNTPTNPGQNDNTHTKKETAAVNSYDKSIQRTQPSSDVYATGSGATEDYALNTKPSETTALGGVDKSVAKKGDKSVKAVIGQHSTIAPDRCVGKNLETACESADLIARANRPGCSDREKEALFARFADLNLESVRLAFVAELEENLAKRGFRNVKDQKREMNFRGEGRTESIVDGQVKSLLRIWFFDPSLTKNYDPAMGVLLSTYRRHDIRAAIREVVRECVPVADIWSDDNIDDSEDERESIIFRASRTVAYDDSEEIFAFDESEFASAFDAQAASAEETVQGIAASNYKQSEGFRQLLDVLEDLTDAGKLSVDNRRAFILSIVNNSTISGQIVGRKPNAIRQATLRIREKLHKICDARGDELAALKELLVALEARSN